MLHLSTRVCSSHGHCGKALLDTADSEDLILMWTINFGLNLNETTEEGPRSISVQSDIRDAPWHHVAPEMG